MKKLAIKLMRKRVVFALSFLLFTLISGPVFSQTSGKNSGESYRSYLKELDREESGDTKFIDYELTVYFNGYKTYGLSHLVIGLPCGEVSDYSNSEGYDMEANSVDPKSGLKGLKIDNISRFGEEKNRNDQFKVKFRLNSSDANCFVGENEVNILYKAGRSTSNETHIVEGFNLNGPTTYNSARIINPGEYCLGEINEIHVELGGNCPWLLGFSINGELFYEVVTTTVYEIPVTVSGEYKLISVQDSDGTFGEVFGEVLVVEPPNGEILGGGTICEGQEAEVIFEFDGQGPYNFTYTDGSSEFSLSTNDDRYVLTTGTAGDYQLLSISNGACFVDGFDKIVEVNVVEIGAEISGGGDILPGESAILKFEMKGTGPWTVEYTNGEQDFSFETAENTHFVESSTPGEYKIVSVSNDQCTGKGTGVAVIYELPTAVFTDETVEICGGNSSGTIHVELTGNGPWWIVYTIDGEERVKQGIETNSYELMIEESGVYVLKKVYDRNQKEGVAEGTTTVTGGTLPTATISDGGKICEGDEKELTITLTGDGPWTFRYSFNDEIHSVTTDQPTYSLVVDEDARIEVLFVSTETCSNELQGVVAEVDVIDLPTAHISGGGNFYYGESVNLDFDLGGQGPWTVVYTDGTNEYTFETDESSYSVAVDETADWTVVSVSSGECDNNGEGEASSYLLSSVVFAGNTDVINACSNEVDIAGVTISGQGNWTIEVQADYPDGTSEILTYEQDQFPGSPEHVYFFPFQEEGSYTLISIKDENGIEGRATGTIVINIFDQPGAEVSGNATICSGEETVITVDFSGDGPFHLVYTLNGEQQEISTDNSSHQIGVSESVLFELVSVSNEICETVQLDGTVTVVVKEAPSGILTGGGGFYAGESATLRFELDGIGPWTVEYSNGNEVMSFTTSDSVYEVMTDDEGTYSIKSITSNGCTVEGEGTVEVFVISTAEITSSDLVLCEGENGEVVVEFTGIGPWDLTYYMNNDLKEITAIIDEEIAIDVTGNATVSLASVTGQNGKEGEVNGDVTIQFNSKPSAEISGGGIFCEGEDGAVRFEMTGTGPWTVTYTANNQQKSFSTDETIYTLEGEDGIYKLISVSDASCSNDDLGNTEVVVETVDLPTALLTGGGAICPDADAELSVALTGNGPWTIVYSDGTSEHTIETDQASHDFTVAAEGTYSIVSVSDSNCTNTGEGSVEVEVKSEISPNGTLDTEATHCLSEEVFLVLNVPGDLNYEVEWSSNGSGEFSSTNAAGAIYVPGPTDETVDFTAVLSNECQTMDLSVSTTIERVNSNFTTDPFTGQFLTGVKYIFVPEDNTNDAYNWSYSDGVETNTSVSARSFANSGTYTLTMSATKGECTESTELTFQVEGNTNIYVPSVFNPEATNPENRVVKVYGEDVSTSEFRFEIYNRWGLLVYNTDSFNDANSVGWIGLRKDEPQENSVFTYILRGKFNNGESFEKTGTITMAK